MPRKTDRRHRQGDESRRAILDATLTIAAERGYDGTTVALVTEATGLPASSIYWHFGSKDELLAATLEHSYRLWRDKAPTWTPPETVDCRRDIEEQYQRGAAALTQSPQFWSMGLLLTLQHRIKEPAALRLYRQVRRDREKELRSWWEAILPPAVLDNDPDLPTRLSRQYMMLMDGLFVQHRAGRARDTRRVVSLLSDGLCAHLDQRQATSSGAAVTA